MSEKTTPVWEPGRFPWSYLFGGIMCSRCTTYGGSHQGIRRDQSFLSIGCTFSQCFLVHRYCLCPAPSRKQYQKPVFLIAHVRIPGVVNSRMRTRAMYRFCSRNGLRLRESTRDRRTQSLPEVTLQVGGPTPSERPVASPRPLGAQSSSSSRLPPHPEHLPGAQRHVLRGRVRGARDTEPPGGDVYLPDDPTGEEWLRSG